MNIEESFRRLEDYIVKEEYKGYDPYDALMSPVFKLPFFRTNKLVRLVSQQVVRRLPFNVRPIVGVNKSLNPVTAGLCVQALSYELRMKSSERDFTTEDNEFRIEKITELVGVLERLATKGYSGICWGYDFDWDGKYISAKAFYPTVVATGIVVNGLFELNYQLSIINSQLKEQKENVELRKRIEGMILSATDFVRKDLKKTYYGDTFCYSYSPGDEQSVLNASMKGVRILAQAYSINGDFSLIEEAEQAVKFVVENQNADGSWGYAKGDTRNWSDSYHTGYILECLKSFVDLTGLDKYKEPLDKGFEFFRKSFVGEDGFPKYYSNEKFPVDCTSAGQIVITLCNFGEYSLAEKVINYMISNMQSPNGYFYYQKGKYFTNKISYMRWSNAWMYVAMARFNYQLSIINSERKNQKRD
ncbi:MAG: hypothetical protein ACOYN6_02760 [Ignavibacteria bacterium]